MTRYQIHRWNNIQSEIKTALDRLCNATSSEFGIMWDEVVEPLLKKRDKMIIAHRKLIK